ncbi:Chemotaxis sensory transducer [Polymorphum gilvum SL003B-26A1]|uniref:Chemotaxis sensory transducer n=1 Tax=Polymorphum gilvum (strain LMG 25793 / CGMCC 1.9160 / SL003B-26A1) TaxID=991905 RepID=F2J316_POLGS|nr:Chemotaxis sensory transducer [Polymorphum gilvum SL003B-26A1]
MGVDLSVRFRILAISFITALGLLAVGGVFWWSQSRVEQAFSASEESASLARATFELAALGDQMRFLEKSYLAEPSEVTFAAFQNELATANSQMAAIQRLAPAQGLSAETADIIDTLSGLEGAFAELNAVQKQVGFDGNSGLRADLSTLAGKAKMRINDELKFGGASDFEKLARTVLEVQLTEREFTLLGGNAEARAAFDGAFAQFEKLLSRAYIPGEVKAEIDATMSSYKAAFDSYAAMLGLRSDKIALVEDLFSLVPPHLSALREAAHAGDAAAVADLAGIREFSTAVIVSVILALLVVLSSLGILIGRSISTPLAQLQRSMERLAAGETAIDLPSDAGKDEISTMVRTVRVFRDNALERHRLARTQDEENARRDERVRRLEQIIADFEAEMAAALGSLDAAARDLSQASATVEAAADEVSSQAGEAGGSVRVAAENVTSAAGATEELAASIREIAERAERSMQVAKRAVEGANSTFTTMQALSGAADRIGAVMNLIRDIASQTNLLALNATIEAGRAGEAGRGFAVVASEVKQLAEQTSKATEDIAAQIEAIQTASAGAVSAIEEVRDIIYDMDALASSVAAAVEQQDGAVQAIALNVNDASGRSDEGAERMTAVVAASEHARQSGVEVERLSRALAEQAGILRGEVRSFLDGVRAA